MMLIIPAESVRLEANLQEPEGAVRGAVILCHPHPLYGGSMDSRVIWRAARAAAAAGYAALRFNFRGVGKSSGRFDHGIGEKEDVVAAINWLAEKYPGRNPALIGYSFGAWVGLQVGCVDPRVKALVGLAVPLDLYDMDFLAGNSKPALYIAGTRDEFCSPENLEALSRKLPGASEMRRIGGAGHFFDGHMDVIESLVTEFFEKLQIGGNTT